jgi:hypothetical protein
MTSDSLGSGSGSAGLAGAGAGDAAAGLEDGAGRAGSSARTDVVTTMASAVAIEADLVPGTTSPDRAEAKASTVGS